jgi:hypothetical protein
VTWHGDPRRIFRQYGPQYQECYADRLSAGPRQALRAIACCRTEALGGHVYRCAACGKMLFGYHSCRNRHCPQCRHAAAQPWLTVQQDLLLPVPYFLLTFTLPAELRSVARQHPRLIYNLLFRAERVDGATRLTRTHQSKDQGAPLKSAPTCNAPPTMAVSHNFGARAS